MSAYSDQVRLYVEQYQRENGESGLVDPQIMAAWAYQKGLMKPNLKTVVDAIAADIAQVFREEYRTDEFGFSYRAKHAVKHKGPDGKSGSLWGDLDDLKAPVEHFVRSFADRRRQIVGDCLQLKTDVDVYNRKRAGDMPFQLTLNFTADIEELQLAVMPPRKAA